MIALDYTQRIAPGLLKAAGVVAVSRYLSLKGLSKVIGKSEYLELLGAGIPVFLNWELNANDWLRGKSVGHSHASEAVMQATELGYPKGWPITGSCDFDVTNVTQVTEYGLAFRDIVQMAGYIPGVYGPTNVLDWAGGAGFGFLWQSMSPGFAGGTNAKVNQHAHWWQSRTPLTVGGVVCDQNRILKDLKGGNDMSAGSDAFIAAYREGDLKASDGGPVAPVEWRVRDEAWQKSVDQRLAALELPVAPSAQEIVAELVKQISAWVDGQK